MLRTAFICALFAAALAVPATGLATHSAPSDGTLVVKNGSAPRGTPVVVLVIRGAAIGQINGGGKVVIEDPTPDDGSTPEASGFGWHKSGDTTDTWGGTEPFRFRAVGGVYKITIYGSGVDLVASGRGTVILSGSPDTPIHDGQYSLNGGDFKSLPATPTKQLPLSVQASNTAG